MADTTVAASLTLDAQQANMSVKAFKTQLREAEESLISVQNKFGATSKEALAAARNVATLRDSVKEAKEVSDLFDPGAKFQAFGNVVRTVAGGFTALTGTMALFGEENEQVEKTLLKVQAALAATEGINTILDATKDFERLSAVIQQTTIFQKANAAATKAAAVVQKLFAGAVDTTSTSFKVLKGAIVATGIGALIVLIGTAIEKINSMASADETAADAKERLAKETERLNKALSEQIQRSDNFAKEEIARLKARGATIEDITKRERRMYEDRIFFAQTALDDARRTGKDEQEFFNRLSNARLDLLLFDLDREAKIREKAEEDAKKTREKAAAAAKADRDRFFQERATAEQQAAEQLKKLRLENELAEIEDESERQERRLIREFEFEKERIEALNLSEKTRIALLQQLYIQEQNALDALYKDRKEKETKKDQERLQEGLDRTVAFLKKEGEAQKENKDKQKAQDDAVFENRQLIINKTSSLLGAAAELFGKHTAAGKVLAIAEATINTFAGATRALREPSVLLQPWSTIHRIAAVGTIIASGLRSIKEIGKIKVPGGGGGGIPSISAAAPLTPQPQVVNTNTALDQDTLNSIGNATVRAFVVESDVTNNQERITRLNRAARLGG